MNSRFSETLAQILDVELEKRERATAPAEAWLSEVIKQPNLRERLPYLHQSIPDLADHPSFEAALALALVTDTLGSRLFLDYIDAREFRYWETEEERADIEAVTQRIWSLTGEAASWLSLAWYNHVLNNAPDRVGTYAQTETLVEKYVRGEINIVGGLGHLGGVLFTGPRFASLVVANCEHQADQDFVEAHLLAHLILGHINRSRFSVWEEYRPGQTPVHIRRDFLHRLFEVEADDFAVCLMNPEIERQQLNVSSMSFVKSAMQFGFPKSVIRLLLRIRHLDHRSIFWTLHAPTHLEPGCLVCGEDRYVYFIGKDRQKHWVCSNLLLQACRKKYRIQLVPNKVLLRHTEGASICTLDQARETGLACENEEGVHAPVVA
jgi:hypothetical protein